MSAEAKPLHVLIADDEPMLRSVIGDFLSAVSDCTHAQVGDGIEALDYLRDHEVHCFLSDARMPRMDLEELLGVVARDFPDTVVVATSGYSDLESACRLLERGAHEFLSKPLNLDLLEQSLAWIARRARILRLARDAFAGADRDMGLNYSHPFQSLISALEECPEPYGRSMRHAVRTSCLAEILTRGQDAAISSELRLAALLHELGASSQQLAIAALPRRLMPNELRFVRTQIAVGGRFLDRALPGRLAGGVVSRHLAWLDQNPAEERSWDDVQRLACMLGVLHSVDALLHERPDRPRCDIEQAHAVLKKLYAETSLSVIKQTLSNWPAIMSYYAEAGLD